MRTYLRPDTARRDELRGILPPSLSEAVRIILAAYPGRPVLVEGGRLA